MNETISPATVVLMLLMATSTAARAGLLENACDGAYEKLGSGPHVSLTKTTENFTIEGKSYRGCVIRLSGNADTINDTQRPDGLFGDALPYCPDGILPADLPPHMVNEDGWCGDKMADGPDGTSYSAIKNNVFCVVEGNWDGGDDGDPTYVPSTRYDVTVKCANR